jgi:signal transduction histidine kinase
MIDETGQRLAHLAYDLHDGPLQAVAALGTELELFRRQLADVLGEEDVRARVLGRVADLKARLAAVDDELRDFARSLESPSLPDVPLRAALEHEIAVVHRETGIVATLDARGDLERLTAPERITVLRCVQSALANVRRHSGARRVHVAVACERTRARAAIRDDGCGFDVDDALFRAAAAGRLGLAGMAERARYLGGKLDVRSRPGGPTTITLTLPVIRRAVTSERPLTMAGAES